MKKSILMVTIGLALFSSSTFAATAIDGKEYKETIPVTVDNFTLVEAQVNFLKWKNKNAMNKMFDLTIPTPAGPMPTVRMNRDTLYSAQLVDASNGFKVHMPKQSVYTSVLVLDEAGYAQEYIWQQGDHDITIDQKHGKFVWVLFRIGLEEGIEQARVVQKQLKLTGQGSAVWNPKAYDQDSYQAMHDANMQKAIDSGMLLEYGFQSDRITNEAKSLSDAVGWGGMDHNINNYQVAGNMDGGACYTTTFADPKVDEFWSFTVYDADGWLLPMEYKSVINSNEAVANADGTYTISFNCGDDAINNLESGGNAGFGFAWRTYASSYKVKSGKWNPINNLIKQK